MVSLVPCVSKSVLRKSNNCCGLTVIIRLVTLTEDRHDLVISPSFKFSSEISIKSRETAAHFNSATPSHNPSIAVG